MTIKKEFVLLSLLVGASVSMAAHAFSIQEDHGDWALIRCSDGSNSTVKQDSDGYWTVTIAGKMGSTGGHFAIIGQAAQKGCGE